MERITDFHAWELVTLSVGLALVVWSVGVVFALAVARWVTGDERPVHARAATPLPKAGERDVRTRAEPGVGFAH